MMMELPVIASNWGGNTEFMSQTNSLLVDCEIIPVRQDVKMRWRIWRGIIGRNHQRNTRANICVGCLMIPAKAGNWGGFSENAGAF